MKRNYDAEVAQDNEIQLRPRKLIKKDIHVHHDSRPNPFISPPVTPEKQRVTDISNILSDSDKGVKKLQFSTPPSTPQKLKKTTVFSKAKSLFQRSKNSERDDNELCYLSGREEEASSLNQFLLHAIQDKICDSMYISGPPGTGKTAQAEISLNFLMNKDSCKLDADTSIIGGSVVRFIKFNCMSISNPENVYHQIYCALDKSKKKSAVSYNKKMMADDLYALLVDFSEVNHVIVLFDEMDCLVTRNQQVLFQLFNFASSSNSNLFKCKLTLVGISNSLDFTEKFLPKLKKSNLITQSLQFLPYTSKQIELIILKKLRSLIMFDQDKENNPNSSFVPMMHPVAVQLCCRKAASVTGDLRKALDLCYKSIELVETSARKDPSAQEYTFYTAPRVMLSHVAKVCESTFKISGSLKIQGLNLMQKAVLCSLFAYKIQDPAQDLTTNCFYDFYSKQIKLHMDNLLSGLKKGEFIEIIHALEASSVIILYEKRASKFTSIEIGNKFIKPNIAYEDLLSSIRSVGILKKMLPAPRS